MYNEEAELLNLNLIDSLDFTSQLEMYTKINEGFEVVKSDSLAGYSRLQQKPALLRELH